MRHVRSSTFIAVVIVNCSFPYTYNGGLYYRCIENVIYVPATSPQPPLACINVNATPVVCHSPGGLQADYLHPFRSIVSTRYLELLFLPPPRRISNRRLSVCLSVYLLATLRKNFQTDLHEIFRNGWQWANEQRIKFWRRSGSRIRMQIPIRICIATLVRRALVEACTVPLLLI